MIWPLSTILYQQTDYIVRQNWRYRWLAQPDGTIHTRLLRKSIHRPALDYMKPIISLCEKPDSDILMLGLGGGGLLHALDHKLVQPKFDVVEINPDIIQLSQRYFYLDMIKNKRIFCLDAAKYIQSCPYQYDYIVIDLYQGTVYPRHCMQVPFFKHCQNLLHDEGLVLINVANISQYKSLLHQLRKVFQASIVTIRINHPRNLILVLTNMSIQQLLDRIQLKEVCWQEQLGVVGRI